MLASLLVPGVISNSDSGSYWPDGGGPPCEIRAGDWVTFRRGFQCTWIVHEPIAKRYAYFDKDGREIPGS